MKRFSLIAAVLLVCGAACADHYFFTVVEKDGQPVRSNGKTRLEQVPAKRAKNIKRGDMNIFFWYCEVSEAQYNGQWDDVPQAVKDAQRALAVDQASDPAEADKYLKAVSEATRKSVNELRVMAGTNTLSKAQWRQRVKAEFRE